VRVSSRLPAWCRRLPGYPVGLGALIVVQAAWLSALSSRGWFYEDDFTYLSQALHQRLGWSYLTEGINDHLAPGVRLTFWVLADTTRLNYDVTIVARVLLQAVATLLLYRLLVQICGSRGLSLGITFGYAVCPLLVPGTLWLASSVNLLPAQILVIVAYGAHVRHARSGSLGYSLLAGLALLVAECFWEETAVTLVLLAVLSIGWLSSGSPWQRVRAIGVDWLGWVLTIAPTAAFFAYFLGHGYGSSARSLSASNAWHLIWTQWSKALWPSVIGGPWHWFAVGNVYASVAAPTDVLVIAGQVAFGLLVVASWWRRGWSGVLAWVLPILAVSIGQVLVGIGRFDQFGGLSGITFSYAFDLAVPTAVAAALGLGRRPAAVGDGAQPTTADQPEPDEVATAGRARRAAGRVGVVVAGALAVALLASSVVSAVRWTSRWHASPARSYTAALFGDARRAGPQADVADSPVSQGVLSFESPHRFVSDLLALDGSTVALNSGSQKALVVAADGHLRPSTFVRAVALRGGHNAFCANLLRGKETVTLHTAHQVPVGSYVVQISYFQKHPTTLIVAARDASGRPIEVLNGGTVTVRSTLGELLVDLEIGSPGSISLTSNDPATNFCAASGAIGGLEVAPGG
jgi:hypothetical protein